MAKKDEYTDKDIHELENAVTIHSECGGTLKEVTAFKCEKCGRSGTDLQYDEHGHASLHDDILLGPPESGDAF